MSYSKKRKIEIAPTGTTKSILATEVAPLPLIIKRKSRQSDQTNIYAKSHIPGKDMKDYMISLKTLTNILLPKWSLTMKSFGLNYAGGHSGDDVFGGHRTAFVASGTGFATDSDQCALDDYRYEPRGWCDTIAWEAGSQAWYESVFLPATWRAYGNSDLEKLYIKNQCSMEGIIENLWNIVPPNFRSTMHPTDGDAASDRADFGIHYNGGFQSHTFSNLSGFPVYFEAYECVPRDIMDWFYQLPLTNTRVVCRNIHSYISNDYKIRQSQYTGGESASTDPGTYNTGAGVYNTNGQRIGRKEDIGFKISSWNDSLLQRFRVSKPISGSIEPGAKFVYTMKTKPFFMLNSAYRRLYTVRANDSNPTDDTFVYGVDHTHLVPKFSKILVVRFWSDVSVKTTDGVPDITDGNWHSYSEVANGPGRVVHTMVEHHTARCIPHQNVNNHEYKNFLMTPANQSASDANQWMQVNDETDDPTQLS